MAANGGETSTVASLARVKLVAAVVAALLFLCSGLALAAGDDDSQVDNTGSDPSLSAPPAGPDGVELEGARTATSQTFLLSDGSRETRIYETPINYRDFAGDWKPIDEGLEEAGGEAVTNGQNSFDVSLPDQLDSDPVSLSVDEQWVSSQYLGSGTEAVDLDGSVATYEASGGGASFDFTGLANGLKEEIEIEDPSKPSRYSFLLHASSGLTPSLVVGGAVEFQNPQGEAVVTIPPPVMSDSAPAPVLSRAASYELEAEGDDQWRLVVAANRSWLDDPDRVWPVHLDPTLTLPSPKLDCTIGAKKWEVDEGKVGWRDCGAWGRRDLLAQYAPQVGEKEDGWARTLLRFATDTIPTNATVTSASFGIHADEAAENTAGVELRQVSKPWSESVNWMQYDGEGHPWTVAGGDYTQSLGEILTSVRGSAAGWWTFPLKTSVVQEEVAKKAPLSFMAKLLDDKSRECGPTNCVARSLKFNSSAAIDAGKRPYLSVVYELKTPIVAAKAASSVGETVATLNAGVNPNGINTTYKFEYGTTTSYGKVIPTTPKSIGSGKAEVLVGEPVTGLSPKTTYHFRVSASNSAGTTLGADKSFTTGKWPTATTEAATGVKASQVNLNGIVNPNGQATSYQFEYGLTSAYGALYPGTWLSIGSGSTPVPVSLPLGGLSELTTYHYRVAAKSGTEIVYGADKTFTTLDAPQTTITSPQPTYTSREMSSIQFASDQAGSTFKCGLDEGEKATKTCTSPYAVPGTLKNGWHSFVVVATNSAGVEDPSPARYTFNPDIPQAAPVTSKLSSPAEGEQSAGYFTLQAGWKSGAEVTGVTFQMKLKSWGEFRTIPGSCVKDSNGSQVSWPLPQTAQSFGKSSPVFFKVYSCSAFVKDGYPSDLKFRAVFDGTTSAAGASEPVAVEYLSPSSLQQGAPTDAKQQVGPASVDLLTGQYTITRTDVSIPVPGSEASLEFTRSYQSNYDGPGLKVLGRYWHPSAPVEQEYAGEAWTELRERHEPAVPAQYDSECEAEGFTHEECLIEVAIPAADWIELSDNQGPAAAFEIQGGAYVAPDYMKEWVLTKQGSGTGSTFELVGPEGTHTVFSMNNVGASESETYRATSVSWQSSSKAARLVYELIENLGKYRLKAMIAPALAGVTCTDSGAPTTPGCRSLSFEYTTGKTHDEDRLSSIVYHNSSGQAAQAQPVAEYAYDANLQLVAEWDPRVSSLKESYTYGATGSPYKLSTLTPPGLEPVTFGYYGLTERKKLRSVSHPSLPPSSTTAQTTIAYEVPVSGSGAPYDMSPASIASWGQADYPVNATAIFPPTEVPGEAPSDYSQATVFYMDPDGYAVNTASPQKPGASGPSISTSEVDRHGDVVRSLSAQNRLLALAAGAESAARSRQLDTQATYSADGTEMLSSTGPLHQVRLESGATAQARSYTSVQYDQGAPTPPAGTPWPHLPTTESAGALLADGSHVDWRTTETKYDWSLRKPTDSIVDPGTSPHLNLDTHTSYDSTTGQVSAVSLPSAPAEGADAHTTRTVYYTAASGSGPCEGNPVWAGLPCEVKPAAQPGTAGQPEILVTKFKKYSPLGQPEEIVESPGGSEANTRQTVIEYDTAGREVKKTVIGGGASIAPTQTTYDPLKGLPVETKLICQKECAGFDDQALKTTYDALGRPVSYQDADGNTATTTYDLMGRPVTTSDEKGAQTAVYDPVSGALTQLQDSAAGTFTAAYNADGAITERGLPNGLVAKTTYDETGTPTHLSYVKTTMCSVSCTWLDFNSEESIHGQVLSQSSTLSSQVYSYDSAGRLTRTLDAAQGGSCTTRSYSYDKDSNRTALVTREPGVGGACDTTSTGATKSYGYDAADRLIGTGISYDGFGRITTLSASYAGGGTLATSYFSNEMVAVQSQGAITNTFQLDSAGRQRQRLQGGGLEGTEIFHYDGGSDAPAWTVRGSTWTRNIVGIGGELAAIQDSSSGNTTLQLTNLHGDIVATASLSQSANKLVATFESDEFGNPKQPGPFRYGWLGGKQRRTEFPSGVVQMGVRSYVPGIGRFISTDPVLGGSANTYDYANADPVNNFDPSGKKPYDFDRSGPCEGQLHVYSPANRNGRNGYGKFHARFRVYCGARGYVVSVLKITRRLETTSDGRTISEHSRQPANPSGPHWNNNTWGNWSGGKPTTFGCVNGQEYQYTYEIQYQYASVGGAATNKDGDSAFEPGGGSMELKAQEYCGHGRY